MLDAWLDALKREKAAYPVHDRMLRSWSSDEIPSLFPAVTADREGRFTLKGVGRERIATLLVGGPGIETRVRVRRDPRHARGEGRRFRSARVTEHDITYHGATFDLVAGPGLEIVGTVRDKDTGKPLAGVTVQKTASFGDWPLRFLKTTTDAEGPLPAPGAATEDQFR